MEFKEPHLEQQFRSRPKLLREMAAAFDEVCKQMSKPCIVTRVTDRVEGESGVHPAGRAVDFRDEHLGKRLFSDAEVKLILGRINGLYPRKDKYKTLIHHGFKNGPKHWHLQVPANLENGIWTKTKSSLLSALRSSLSRVLS